MANGFILYGVIRQSDFDSKNDMTNQDETNRMDDYFFGLVSGRRM